MRICFVGPANSSHIVKWCNWFVSHGHDVHVISFTPGDINKATVHLIKLSVNTKGSDFGKLKYLFTGRIIRKIIEIIKPNIINAHYATSYGVAMALSGIKGYILSVWGSDIYVFPKKSLFHKQLLKYSLRKATYLFSTSKAMAIETAKYSNKNPFITPFGVDINLFNPNKRTRVKGDGLIVVGTVKTLADIYGIKDILLAVSILNKKMSIPIKLRIAGTGPKEDEYHRLAIDLGIDNITTWLGFINPIQAAEEWANMDIAIIPSLSESFGVSAVEAQSCGTAVIVSNAPGLMETTNPGVSSIVVRKSNPTDIVEAVLLLVNDCKKRKNFGIKGREYIVNNFSLEVCFKKIEDLFFSFISNQ